MTLKKKIIIASVLVLGIAMLVGRMLRTEATVAPVVRGKAVDAVSGNVEVFAAVDITLLAEATGPVVEAILSPGEGSIHVEAGQVILQIDPSDIERRIANTKANLKAAEDRLKLGSPKQYELENLLQDLSHNEQLAKEDQFPEAWVQKQRRDVERLKSEVKRQQVDLEASIENNRFALELEELELKATKVEAPVSGEIIECFVSVGERVSRGSPLVRIISDDRVVKVTLSEDDFRGVEPGKALSVNFLGSDQLFKGEILSVDATSDPRSRRRTVYAKLDVDSGSLIPGMTGQASIVKDEHLNALLVPRRALLGNAILFVDKGGHVVRKQVSVGYVGLHWAEIQSGLEEGDLVIIDDLYAYRDGERVHPVVSK
ncbi:MAG: efflux RND transporter periplasmic adaptor subunit [Opitutales bacterium]|tara:strand:- start:14 stop:1129 length:1116 start_codon:yes stop_codon:yes gene_type:complete